jgi:hypothetical protein
MVATSRLEGTNLVLVGRLTPKSASFAAIVGGWV